MKALIALALLLAVVGCAQPGIDTTTNATGAASPQAPYGTPTGPTGQAVANESGVPPGSAQMTVTAQDITYGNNYTGFLARPAGNGTYPGVVMIHEYWGLNANIRNMARVLAAQGYSVLAVDLFNGTVAATPDQAMQLVSQVNRSDALANMQSAAAYLRAEGAPRVASLGWCFGGGESLELALNEPSLDAAALYYGSPLVTNETLRALDMPVLGVFGDTDTVVPVQQVEAFNQTLSRLNITHEVYLYPGVGHAFANPSNPGYDREKTADAWNKTLAFLDRNLKSNAST